MVKFYLYSKQNPTEGKGIFKTFDGAFHRVKLLAQLYADEVFIIEEIETTKTVTEIKFICGGYEIKTKINVE